MSKDNKRFWYIQATKRRMAMPTEAEAVEVLNELTDKEHIASAGEGKPLTAKERLDKQYAMNKLFAGSRNSREER